MIVQHCKTELSKVYKDVFTKNGNLRINDGFKRKLMDLEMELFSKNTLDFFAKKGRRHGLTEMEVDEPEPEPWAVDDDLAGGNGIEAILEDSPDGNNPFLFVLVLILF